MSSWLKIALSPVRTATRSPLLFLCVVAPKILLSSATSIVPTSTNQRSSLITKSLTSISILPVLSQMPAIFFYSQMHIQEFSSHKLVKRHNVRNDISVNKYYLHEKLVYSEENTLTLRQKKILKNEEKCIYIVDNARSKHHILCAGVFTRSGYQLGNRNGS